MTDEFITEVKDTIKELASNPDYASDLEQGLGDDIAMVTEAFMKVGEYLGISSEEVLNYISSLRFIFNKSISDSNYIYS